MCDALKNILKQPEANPLRIRMREVKSFSHGFTRKYKGVEREKERKMGKLVKNKMAVTTHLSRSEPSSRGWRRTTLLTVFLFKDNEASFSRNKAW